MKHRPVILATILLVSVAFDLGVNLFNIQNAVYSLVLLAVLGGMVLYALLTFHTEELKHFWEIYTSLQVQLAARGKIGREMLEISLKCKKRGFLAIEPDVQKIKISFLREGLQQVVDGKKTGYIKNYFDSAIHELRLQNFKLIKFLQSIDTILPWLGMVFTLIILAIAFKTQGIEANKLSYLFKALLPLIITTVIHILFFAPLMTRISFANQEISSFYDNIAKVVLGMSNGVQISLLKACLAPYLQDEEEFWHPIKKVLFQGK